MSSRIFAVIAAAIVMMVIGITNAGATADPLWQKQYGPVQIGAPTAWQKSMGKSVKVAVVDSGVDVDHPDLRPNLLLNDSYDFACNDANPDDDSTLIDSEGKKVKGHGTHVSGTVAAVANNNIGVAGVAPDVKLMVMKVFGTDDSCGGLVSLLAISNAINRSVQRGAKVINLSLGTFAIGDIGGPVQTSCEQAFSRGSLCVVSSGNSGESKPSGYPYDFNGMIVTANDNIGAHASFGQKADTKWGVSAPGVGVLSTWPIDDQDHDGYNTIAGTSMAAPHVTGAAALLFGMGLNAQQVAEKLVATAGPPRNSLIEGAGLIHVDRAAGFEPVVTTTKQGPNSGAVTNAPGTRGGRAGAGGGTNAVAPTTTVVTTFSQRPGTDFEEGIGSDDANDFNALRLKEAGKRGADQPFNVAGILVGISAAAAVAMVALAIPRLRSKDAPPLS